MLSKALYRAFYPGNQMSWSEAFLLAGAAAPGGYLLFASAYLVKSALGINLMPGPSPLHDLLYWMIA